MGFEIGDYEIGDALVEGDDFASMLGASDYAMLGAAVAKANPAVANAIIAKKARDGVLVKRQNASDFKKRIYLLGFDSVTAVAAAGQAVLNAQPQVPFKGTRLLIPGTIGAGFIVNTLVIGIHPQFISSTGIPGQSFSETVTDNDMEMNTCNPGVQISLTVTNIGGAGQRFLASIRGIALQD